MTGEPRALILLAALGSACAAPATVRQPIPCDQHAACPPAHTCRWTRVNGKVVGECRLEVGRCFSDWDCLPQRCQRFQAEPGVCVMNGL